MAEAILAASKQSAESLNRMGSTGREYALESYTREANLSRVVEIVEQAGKVAE
jgi:hypothetical protein